MKNNNGWRNFLNVINKAKIACQNSGLNPDGDFVYVNKIVEAGAAHKDIGDIILSRYVCYLIVQNVASYRAELKLQKEVEGKSSVFGGSSDIEKWHKKLPLR